MKKIDKLFKIILYIIFSPIALLIYIPLIILDKIDKFCATGRYDCNKFPLTCDKNSNKKLKK